MEKGNAWKEARRRGIGGSDIAAICGANPWKTPYDVWKEKVDPFAEEIPETPAMRRGKILEPVIIEEYLEKTGRKRGEFVMTAERVLNPNPLLVRHKDCEYLLGSPDLPALLDGDRGPGGLEAKAPGLRVYSKIKREGLPLMWSLQGYHYMEVMGYAWWSFAIFCADLWELLWFDIERNPETQQMLIDRAGLFWDFVKRMQPPPIDTPELPDMPPTEHGLQKIETPEWAQAVRDLRMAQGIQDEAALLVKGAQERIKGMMKATIAEGAGARVYQTPRRAFNEDKFHKERPVEYNRYCTAFDAAQFRRMNKAMYERYMDETENKPFRVYYLKGENLEE